MIRTRTQINVTPLEDFADFAKDFVNVSADLAQESADKIAPDYRDELAFEPRVSVHPFVWSDDPAADARARGWWFANLAEGNIPTDGERYIRSSGLSESWVVRLEINGSEFELIAESKYKGAKWVVGTFDRRRNWQIPGHETTGWVRVRETADFWHEAFIEDYRQRFNKVVDATLGSFETGRRNR